MTMERPQKLSLFISETEALYRYLYQAAPLNASIDVLGITPDFNLGDLQHVMETMSPAILLIGLRRAGEEDLKAIGRLRQEYPDVGIALILTMCTASDVEQARQAASKGRGGLAVFLRNDIRDISQLIDILLCVARGRLMVDPVVARIAMTQKPESSFLKRLTAKELEILRLLSSGHSNAAIADMLYVDIKTVEGHLNGIYSKMRADSDTASKHLRVTAATLFLREAEYSAR